MSGAVKLYLRSQVEHAEDLQVKIVGKSKQILKGYIPQVLLTSDQAVYQGLYLSQVKLKGTDIAVNLPEVIKKKPLRLLEPIFVEIQLKLDAADLQASLDSTLLQSGLSDLWQMILAAQSYTELGNLLVEWESIAIANQQLNLSGIYQDTSGETRQLTLATEIDLANPHTLCLSSLKIISDSLNNNLDHQLEIDLGTDIDLAELTIESEQIVCVGKIKVNN